MYKLMFEKSKYAGSCKEQNDRCFKTTLFGVRSLTDGREDDGDGDGEEDSKDFLSSLGRRSLRRGRADDDRDDDCHLQRIRSVPQKTGDAGARWGGS